MIIESTGILLLTALANVRVRIHPLKTQKYLFIALRQIKVLPDWV